MSVLPLMLFQKKWKLYNYVEILNYHSFSIIATSQLFFGVLYNMQSKCDINFRFGCLVQSETKDLLF